jgi:D-alanyl-D-alanine carboxypeptidase/D-alanyl-D-alanine-endopeptidase (penicillin-binding protein 4)
LTFSILLNGYQGGAPKDIEARIAVRFAAGKVESTPTLYRRSTTPDGGRLEWSWTHCC